MASVTTSICLIRHGETTWNRAGLWQGHADPELTETGLLQARRLAELFAVEQAVRPWNRIFASDLLRARATALQIAEALDLPLAVDPRLRELDVGRWSGLTRAEIAALDEATLRAFESGAPGVRPGGGETRIEIRERSHAFVCELARRHAGERVLVVTHLGVIRALVPGARPQNADRIELCAEEIAARPIDRAQRPEEGPL
ncbi:MAG: histidine phosphatase family protein [Deltaproteobacteria bacterium]|nr:histidine phosphatase family protein [Deltaproteobacteria bacterium]